MSATAERARMHAFSSGRVTGVFYRMFVLKEAQALGLTGYVRNLVDGRVEVVAEGPRRGLQRLVELLREGPRGATVEHVETEWEACLDEFDGFRIDYL
jgi:acylphosphatase